MILPDCLEELIKKVNEGIENEKSDFLLGCIDIDTVCHEQLLVIARSLIAGEIVLLKRDRNTLISFALVSFAIKDYNNGQFWNEFAEKLCLDSHDVMNYCKSTFETFCKNNDLYFHTGKVNKGYVTSILTHSIIPTSMIDKFLDFLSDLYFRDLEEDYIDEEVEELIHYMHRLFSKYLDDDDISFIVQGSKMTIARQHLPKAFRIAFVKAAGVVAPIIERLLLYIHQVHYGARIEYLVNDRFDEYFSDYDTESKFKIKKSLKNSGAKREVKFHKAQYFYNERKLYMQIPKQIIDADYADNKIVIELCTGDDRIHIQEVSLTKSRMFLRTNQVTIEIPKFDSKIRYRIISGEHIVYDSKAILNREFLLFDLNGHELNPKQIKKGMIRVVTNEDNEILYDDDFDVFAEENYKIVTLNMHNDCLLLIGDKAITCNRAELNAGVSDRYRYQELVLKDRDGNEYECFSNNPEFRIRMKYQTCIYDYIININGCNYELADISDYKLTDITDGTGDCLAIINLNEKYLRSPSKITLRVKGSYDSCLSINFVMVGLITYQFDKEIYYKEKEAKLLSFESSQLKLVGKKIFPQTLKLSQNHFFIVEVDFNDQILEMLLQLPVLKWEMDDISSDMKSSNTLWRNDLHDHIFKLTFTEKIDKLHVVSDMGYEQVVSKSMSNETTFALGYLFSIEDQGKITIGVKLKNQDICLTEIYSRPTLLDFSVAYYDNRHLMQGLYSNWKFIGEGDLNVNIIYSPNGRVIKSYTLKHDETLLDQDLNLYYNKHEIEIYQNEEDFFGEVDRKNILISKSFTVGDEVLVTCRNQVLKGISCESDSVSYTLSNFYLKDVRFSRRKGYYEAEGLYHIEDRYTGKTKEWYFSNNNPFLLKHLSTNKNKLTFEIIDCDEDGLIYDTKTHYINPREERRDTKYVLIDTITLEINE